MSHVPEDAHFSDTQLLDQVSAELDAVDTALVRLESGSFDTCDTCGATIGLDRLLENPLLTRCPAHS